MWVNVTDKTTEETESLLQQTSNGQYEIVICTYDKMLKVCDDLAKVNWNVIVFDEGHILKNETSLKVSFFLMIFCCSNHTHSYIYTHTYQNLKKSQYLAAMKLKKARVRFILTGTPIQNNLSELWVIMNLVTARGFKTKKEYVEHFQKPIGKLLNLKSSFEVQELGRRRRKELQTLMEKRMIGRKKEELSGEFQLKGKKDNIVLCDLSELQSRLYSHVISLPDFENMRDSNRYCDCERNLKKRKKDRLPRKSKKNDPFLYNFFFFFFLSFFIFFLYLSISFFLSLCVC